MFPIRGKITLFDTAVSKSSTMHSQGISVMLLLQYQVDIVLCMKYQNHSHQKQRTNRRVFNCNASVVKNNPQASIEFTGGLLICFAFHTQGATQSHKCQLTQSALISEEQSYYNFKKTCGCHFLAQMCSHL